MSEFPKSPVREPAKDFPYFRRTWNTVVVMLLAAAFVPLVIIGGGMYFYMSSLLKQKTIESLRADALDLKNSVDQFLAERTMNLRLISENIGLDGLRDPTNLASVFYSLQQQLSCFADLGVIGEQGRHLAYVGTYDLLSKNYSDAEWFQTAMSRGVYVSDVFLGHRNVPHFIIAVKAEDRGRPWFLRATIDTEYFHGMIADMAAKRKAQAYFVNRQGQYQTVPNPESRLMGPSPFTDLKPAPGVTYNESDDHLLMTVWLEKVPWLGVVQISRKDAFGDLARIRAIGIWVFILAAILLVMTVLLTTNNLVSRLEVKRRSIRFLDRQLRQSNRLASAMELSFGFFREITDTLTNIDAAAACLEDFSKKGDWQNTSESLAQIRSEAGRSRRSIDRFLKFTQSAEPIIKELNLNAVLDEMIEFLDKELRFKNIGVRRNYEASLPGIRSDPAELRQVFQNLILNAISAIQANGTITLTTQRQAETVMVSITDTGPGIAEGFIDRIFEPLFTTKPGGTGLGLTICVDILTRLGGHITAHNHPEGGACFVVQLPLKFTRPAENGGVPSG
jgi:two-component system NtrC family sensor kinase